MNKQSINASYSEIIRVIQPESAASLGADIGTGQSCIYMHAGSLTHRLELDLTGNTYMLTALAMIEWMHPQLEQPRRTALISNNLPDYERMRTLDSVSPEALADTLRDGGFTSLIADLIFTMAGECGGDVLFLPVPEGCCAGTLESFRACADNIFQVYRSRAASIDDAEVRKALALFLPYRELQLVPARFSGIFQNFKTSPEDWFEDYDDSFIFRELMAAYAGALFRSAIRINPEIFETLQNGSPDGEIPGKEAVLHCVQTALNPLPAGATLYQCPPRIIVGCPASSNWTSEDNTKLYCELISDVLRSLHFAVEDPDAVSEDAPVLKNPCRVEIFPEPCAAILPHMTGGREGSAPDINRGIAIHDCGALSYDITFVYYSDAKTYRYSCSTDLIGGAQLDRNMLKILVSRALKKRVEAGLDTNFIPDELAHICLYLRTVKENYYPGRTNDTQCSVSFHFSDGSLHTERFLPGELLHEALNLKYSPKNLPAGSREKSWLEYARDFNDEALRRFRNSVAADFEFSTLILTGGTSNVCELRDLLNACPAYRNMIVDDDTSGCVANGLALTLSPVELEDFRDSVSFQSLYFSHSKDFIDETARILAEGLPPLMHSAIDFFLEDKRGCTMQALADRIHTELENDLQLNEKLDAALGEYVQSIADSVTEAANKYASEFFPGRIPKLGAGSQNASAAQNGIGADVARALLASMDLKSMLSKTVGFLLGSAIDIAVSIALAFIPLVGPALATVYIVARTQDRLEKKPPKNNGSKHLSAGKLKKVRKCLNDYRFSSKIESAVSDAFTKNDPGKSIRKLLVRKTVSYITMTHFDFDPSVPIIR